MARILIVGFDEVVGRSLVDQLRLRRHFVEICPLHSNQVQRCNKEVDIVILDLSKDDISARMVLELLIQHRAETGLKPMMLGVFQSYRGPRVESEIERKGVRVVYVA
jgi:hypothetical protein